MNLYPKISELHHTANSNYHFGLIPSVIKEADAKLPTKYGQFRIAGYRSLTSYEKFVVVYKGKLRTDHPVAVRIHSQCLTGDVFHSSKCDCGDQLNLAMQTIAREGRGTGIINKIRAYA